MKRQSKPKTSKNLAVKQQVISEILSRNGLSRRLGYQYGDKRKVYKALGYPEEGDLTFEYYYNKYDRQDFASAVIDRPCDATWRGDIVIKEVDTLTKESKLNKAWKSIEQTFGLKKRLNKVDKLCDLGRYSVLMLGLDDVKEIKDFQNPVAGGTRKLLYVKQVAESEADVHTWDDNPKSPRYGLPVLYRIRSGTAQTVGSTTTTIEEYRDLTVHYSRIIHYVSGNLTSEVYGVSKLKKIINRLVDLEKILGGDAEMFWRGARPGYTATAKEDYELGTEEEAALMEELDKYEHDLRRFIVAKGIDIAALEQQLSDPLNHIDAQLQAISAQTGIPKRILIGSERGELASSQDRDQWKELILTRQEEHAEPTILRPFINRLMEYKILPFSDNYTIIWDDVFAPSEADKAKIGKERAGALKDYTDSPVASSMLPPAMALKHILGLNDDQVEEIMRGVDDQGLEEALLQARIAAMPPEPKTETETEDAI
jgi:hypothetical protein